MKQQSSNNPGLDYISCAPDIHFTANSCRERLLCDIIFWYAIPAIYFSTTKIIASPILSLIYQLQYKILTYVGVKIIFSLLDKLKPLFQGAFKDEYRFFSGLYFLYRFFLLFKCHSSIKKCWLHHLKFGTVHIITSAFHLPILQAEVEQHHWYSSLYQSCYYHS